MVLLAKKWGQMQAPHRLSNVGVRIRERLKRPPGSYAEFSLKICLEPVFGDVFEPAVGVMNEDDLLGPKRSL